MVQAALLSMEINTGQVRTMMGGKDFADSTFNRATQAHRQPGSAFKPIIYAAAVERGFRPQFHSPGRTPVPARGPARADVVAPELRPQVLWTHSPVHRPGPLPEHSGGAHDDGHGGSRGGQHGQNPGDRLPVYPNYASALGASEVTLLELTRAYSVFPNRGNLIEPVFIDRLEDRDGRTLFEGRPRRQRVLTQESADIMTNLLIGVVERGTATRVRVLQRPVGGKTGTTNKTRDAWFIGLPRR
jgi:penicillin-binding protein 1A